MDWKRGAMMERQGEGENGNRMRMRLFYVGRNSTRYHRSRSCHYLVNNLSPVAFSEIEGLRNKSGGKLLCL